MGHPQNSVRGLFYKGAIGFGSTGIFALEYSEGTAVFTSDSTGVIDCKVGFTLGGNANSKLTGNSTGILAAASIFPSGGAIAITANSTAIVVPVLYVGAIPLAANSTGLTISGAQISTA